MKSLLEENLKSISQYNPDLANKIRNCRSFEANYEINPAKSGDSILYKKGIPIDDSIDPVWTALESFSKLEFNIIRSITVLLGIGLGYNFKEISKRYKGKIILHEPNIEFLRIALEFVDFSEELSNKNIMVTHTHEDIKEAYKSLFFKGYKFNFLFSDYYINEDPEYLQEFKRKINNNHALYEQNYNNLWKKNTLWTNLLFQNIPSIVNNQDMHILKNKFPNKTAVILSAGPSLDKNIEEIKAYRDKVIIFCVGVAFKTAVKHGIVPDFLAVIDNRKKVIDIPEIEGVNLIASSNAFEGIFELKPKRFFNHHNKTTPACRWLAEALGIPDIDDYQTAGTVSINCLYTAKLMGCDKIIFTGQDLAYTDNKCYSKDSVYANYSLSESNEVKSKDTLEDTKNHEDFLSRDLIKIKGSKGETLFTRPDYYTFILYFEEIAEKFGSEIKFINATEGGAYLKGFEHITLKEALEKNTGESINIEEILQTIELSDIEIAKRNKKIIKEFNNMIKNFNEAKTIIDLVIKKGIFPYLNFDFRTYFNYFKTNSILDIFIKKIEVPTEISEVQKIVFAEYLNLHVTYIENIQKNAKNLLNNEPQNFSKSLKLMKDNYFKIQEILSLNPYFKMNFLIKFLEIDNQIKDFENNDENLIKLSFELTSFYLYLYYYGPEFIEKILANNINQLEQLQHSMNVHCS